MNEYRGYEVETFLENIFPLYFFDIRPLNWFKSCVGSLESGRSRQNQSEYFFLHILQGDLGPATVNSCHILGFFSFPNVKKLTNRLEI